MSLFIVDPSLKFQVDATDRKLFYDLFYDLGSKLFDLGWVLHKRTYVIGLVTKWILRRIDTGEKYCGDIEAKVEELIGKKIFINFENTLDYYGDLQTTRIRNVLVSGHRLRLDYVEVIDKESMRVIVAIRIIVAKGEPTPGVRIISDKSCFCRSHSNFRGLEYKNWIPFSEGLDLISESSSSSSSSDDDE